MKTVMKQLITNKSMTMPALVLLLALGTVLANDAAAQAQKPSPSLTCIIEYDFVGHLGQFDAEGRLLGWVGTISGDIEGQISWWMVWPPKFVGQTNHFVSRWEIFDSTGALLLAGDDAGTTTVRHGKNSLWRANGTVTEASEEFENWIGCRMHEGGHFTWAAPGLPDHGSGIFRVSSSPPLACTIEYDFVGHLGQFDAEGRLLGWVGTISGDIEGEINWWMGMPPKFVGQTNHFVSRWEIFDSAGALLLAGDDAGTTTVRHGKNSLWRANGTVTEASEEFEDWIGCRMHEGGHFTWAAPGLPDHGEGIFQIN